MADFSLEIVEGPGAGRQLELNGPVVVGRLPGVEVVLDDTQVSRRHARVIPSGDGAVVEDLGSSNGTFVNGVQIHAPTPLASGDELLVGVTLMELRTTRQIQRRPSAVRPVPPPLVVPQQQPSYVDATNVVAASRGTPELDRLLDIRTKSQARMAPLGIFVVATLVVLIYLAAHH